MSQPKTQLARIRESRGGKFIQRLTEKLMENPEQTTHMAIMAGLAYMGYSAYRKAKLTEHEVGGTIGSLMVGPISYQMAISPGGTPPIMKIAGGVGLITLGLNYFEIGKVADWILGGLESPLYVPPDKDDIDNPEVGLEVSQDDYDAAVSLCEEAQKHMIAVPMDACVRKQLIDKGYEFDSKTGKVIKTPYDEPVYGPYVCPECGREFYSNRDLQLHRQAEHYS